ncbi:MAG TPA: hypothetical protein VLI46_04205 [Ramlibacter sp.]|nr:hypothetical protein [Ramlibacter sp.]
MPKKTAATRSAATVPAAMPPAAATITTPATVMNAGLESLKHTAAAQPAPLRHLNTFSALLAQSATRVAGNGAASAALLPKATDFETWKELSAMQGAIFKRLLQQHQDWLQGLAKLGQEYSQIKRANTLSEHAEQQFNLMAQFGDLMKAQATNLLTLQDNIEVNYGYWVSQKVSA